MNSIDGDAGETLLCYPFYKWTGPTKFVLEFCDLSGFGVGKSSLKPMFLELACNGDSSDE